MINQPAGVFDVALSALQAALDSGPVGLECNCGDGCTGDCARALVEKAIATVQAAKQPMTEQQAFFLRWTHDMRVVDRFADGRLLLCDMFNRYHPFMVIDPDGSIHTDLWEYYHIHEEVNSAVS
jgi:hypothetical protein